MVDQRSILIIHFLLIISVIILHLWASKWCSGQEPTCQCRRCKRCGFDPRIGKISLEEGMATHSSILVRSIPWTEKPGGLQSMGSQSWTRFSILAGFERVLFLALFGKISCIHERASLVAQIGKNLPEMWETWVGKIPWRKE